MAVNLSPVGGVAAQFFTSTGAVLTGGKLYTYAAGTTTPQAAYTTSQGNVPWTNPVVLDAAGRVPGSGEIWLTDGIIYKFVLKDSNDVLIATYDNITGINSNSVSYTSQQEIVTATAGQTVFNLGISYQPGTNSLSVFVDGVNQYGPGATYAYTETDGNTVTFNAGLHVGAEVKFTTTQQQGAGAVDASQVSYTPEGAGAVPTNVQAKLRQTVSIWDFIPAAEWPALQAGTSTYDCLTAFTNAINTGLSIEIKNGTFPISGAIYPQSNTTWFGDTSGVLKWTTVNCLIDAQSIGNWTMNGIVVDGNYTAYTPVGAETPWAIRMEQCNNITITNSVFRYLFRIGICVGQSSSNPCRNITIDNNAIHNIGYSTDPVSGFGNGVAVLSASFVKITNNWVYNITGNTNGTAGINLEPGDPAYTVSDIEIAFNKITNCDCAGVQLYMGHPTDYTGDRNNINIHDNSIKTTGTFYGIQCTQFGYTYIRDNFLEQTQGILVKRYKANKAYIEGNEILQVTSGGYGIRIQDGIAGVVIDRNRLRNISGVAISVDMFDYVTTMDAKECLIQNNVITSVTGAGIAFNAGNFVISGNTLNGCSNASDYYIKGLNGGVYQSVNGYIGENTLVSSSGSILAFINCEGDLMNNVQIGNNAYVGPISTTQKTYIFNTTTRIPGAFMDSAPTAGTWKVGDIVWKATPAASGYIGWVCTNASGSGTWKQFGTIQA